MEGVGLAVAVQVVGAVLRAGQRPIGLAAPFVNAHHKDHHRRLLVYPIVHIFQPAVEPSQCCFIDIDNTLGTEVEFSDLWRQANPVIPGANHHVLIILAGRELAETLNLLIVVKHYSSFCRLNVNARTRPAWIN